MAIYARVSTTDQTTENQVLDLQRYCATRGWKALEPFTDTGISGAKEDRPALRQVMELVRKRQVDIVLVWRFDRFARSLTHLVHALEEFRQRGVGFASYQEGIDTDTAQGKMVFGFLASIAEFERSIIIERINAGLRRAKARGKTFGRPNLYKDKIPAIMELRGKASIRQIAARTGVSKSVVQKVLSRNGAQKVAPIVDERQVAF